MGSQDFGFANTDNEMESVSDLESWILFIISYYYNSIADFRQLRHTNHY